MLRPLLATSFLLLAACGTPDRCEKVLCATGSCNPETGTCTVAPADAGERRDAGEVRDSGQPHDAGERPDAGEQPDAGELPDAGEQRDAGEPPDAGELPDSGVLPDAGPVPDAGTPDAGLPDAGQLPCNGACAAQGKQCDESTGSCVQCLSEVHCTPALPRCDPGTKTCVASPLAGDSCGTAQVLAFVGGSAHAQGDTSAATNGNALADSSPTCSNSAKQSGRDLVYTFTLTEARAVTVSVTPTGPSPSFQPVIYLRRAGDCASTLSTHELGCQASGTATRQTLTVPTLSPGIYSLWVDGSGGTAGSFELEVLQATGLNDDCATAAGLNFSGAVAQVSGSTVAATNGNFTSDPSPSCSSTARTSGKDVVYRYTLTEARDVTVTVTPTAAAPGLVPVVYLRPSAQCTSSATANELACAAASSSAAATTRLTNQQPGNYVLWVDGAQSSAGSFDLRVELGPPSLPPLNDLCADALPLTFDSAGTAVVTGDLTLATNGNVSADASPSCSFNARTSGADIVYSFTLSSAQDVSLAVLPKGSSTLRPVVYVRRPGACSSALLADELGCFAATATKPVGLGLKNLPAGMYFVHVDSAGGTGEFELRVVTQPAQNLGHDTCAAPQTLTLGGTTAVAVGSTAGATNWTGTGTGPSCSSAARSRGQDLVYQLVLATPKELTIKVTPLGPAPTLIPVVSVRGMNACEGASSSELGCWAASTFDPASVFMAAQPGAYFIHVDGDYGTSGAFQLEVTAIDAPPPPSNDTCAAPQPLTFVSNVAKVSGSTRWATNSNAATDISPTCSSAATTSGKDVVYSFSVAATSTVWARVVPKPGSGFSPVLYVRKPGVCASGLSTDQLKCATGNTTAGAELMLTALPAGTYSLFVDGSGGTSGEFDLELLLVPPATNDTCSSPILLTQGQTVIGSTVGATDNYSRLTVPAYSAACSDLVTQGTAPDLVYEYVAPAGGIVRLTLTSDFDAALFVLSPSCGPAACVGFIDSPGVNESGTYAVSAGQRFFIVVDGYSSGEQGVFTLRVDPFVP